jgi:hypothetical protein
MVGGAGEWIGSLRIPAALKVLPAKYISSCQLMLFMWYPHFQCDLKFYIRHDASDLYFQRFLFLDSLTFYNQHSYYVLHALVIFTYILCTFLLCSSGHSSWLQNGDVLCFPWGTNWIYICYVEESRPALWSSGQSSWPFNGYVLCFLWGTNWI